MEKNLVTVLKLDGKQFQSDLTSVQKTALGVSAAATGVAVAMGAAAAVAVQATAKYQDATIKASRATGMAVEQYSVLSHAAGLSGLSVEDIGGSMRKLLEPTDDMVKKMAHFGIALKDSSGHTKSQSMMLSDLSTKYKSLKDPADKARIAMAAFGEDGSKMANLLENDFGALATQARLMGKVVSEEAGRAAEKFNDNIAILGGSMEGLRDQISSSVIQLVNQSGIMEKIAGVIQSVTGAWMNMSGTTRETILLIAGMTVGLTALMGGLAAVIAIAPYVGSAITLAMGPVGVTIMVVTAAALGLAAAFALLRDRTKEEAQEATDAAGRFDDLANKKQRLEHQARYSAEAARELNSVNQEMSSIMKTLGIDIGNTNLSLKEQVRLVKEAAISKQADQAADLTVKIYQHNQAIKASNRLIEKYTKDFGANSEAVAHAKKQLDATNAALDSLNKELGKVGTTTANNTTATRSSITSMSDAERAEKRLAEMAKSLAKAQDEAAKKALEMQKAYDGMERKTLGPMFGSLMDLKEGFAEIDKVGGTSIHKFALGTQKAAEMIEGATGPALQAWQNFADAQAKLSKQALDKQLYQLDMFSRAASANMQRDLEIVKEHEANRLEALESSAKEELDALREQEKQKLSVLAQFQSERLLLHDTEYQEAKRLADEAHMLFLESERVKFEEKLLQLDEFNLITAERRATEAVMEEDWRNYVKLLETSHQSDLAGITEAYANKKKGIEITSKLEMETEGEASRTRVEEAEKASNKKLEDEKKASEDRIKKMEDEKTAREKILAKTTAFIRWAGESAALQSSKSLMRSQTIAQGMSAASQALGSMAYLGPVGLIIGAGLAATIMAATSMAVTAIGTQQIPPPPELFFASGGAIRSDIAGGPGAGDVLSARLTPGESVLDVATTRNISSFVERGMDGGSRQIQIYNYNQGFGEINERQLDVLGRELAYRAAREVGAR